LSIYRTSFPFSLRLEMWSERRSLWFRKQNFRKNKKKICLKFWFENIKTKLKNSVVILQNLLFISYHIKLKNSVAILIAIFVELTFRICCDICWTYFQFISQPLMFLIFYFLKLFKKYKKNTCFKWCGSQFSNMALMWHEMVNLCGIWNIYLTF
jgi:hypothetical protein